MSNIMGETCPKCGCYYNPQTTAHCALMEKCHYVTPITTKAMPIQENADAHWLRVWGDDEMARGNVSNAQRYIEIADRLCVLERAICTTRCPFSNSIIGDCLASGKCGCKLGSALGKCHCAKD